MIHHPMPNFIGVMVVGFGGMLGAAAGDVLESHSISLSTVFAVAGVVLPAAWWFSSKMTNLSDRIENLEKQIDRLPCNEKKKEDDCPPKKA